MSRPASLYQRILDTDNLTATSQRVIPQGNMQLLFYRGANVSYLSGKMQGNINHCGILCGHTTGYTDLTFRGSIRITAVVFHPHGAACFFKIPPTEVAGKIVGIAQTGDRQLRELESRLMDTQDDIAGITLIEHFLCGRLPDRQRTDFKRLNKSVALITEHVHQINVSELAEHACLSYKQFQRIFTRQTGITAKIFYARYASSTPLIHSNAKKRRISPIWQPIAAITTSLI